MTYISSCCKAPVDVNVDNSRDFMTCKKCKQPCTIYEANVEYDLQHCKKCVSMTNHLYGNCMRCSHPKNVADTPQSAVEGIAYSREINLIRPILAKYMNEWNNPMLCELAELIRSELSTLLQKENDKMADAILFAKQGWIDEGKEQAMREVEECIGEDEEYPSGFGMLAITNEIRGRNQEKVRIRSLLTQRGLLKNKK